MRKVMVRDYEVTTNLGGNYTLCDGEDKKTMTLVCQKNFRESDKEMLERLAPFYKRVSFYYVTTAVRGYYELVAYVKERD